MRAWVFQATSHKRKHGEKKAPWSVGFYDPAGRKRSKTIGSRSMAEKVAQQFHAQLVTNTYDDKSKVTWEAFIAEYESKVMAAMLPRTKELTQIALNSFERIAKPVRVAAIDSKTIDDFVSVRRTETRRGKEKAPTLAPATINRELRHVRAILRRAVKWGYLKQCPEFTFLRVMDKVPTFVRSSTSRPSMLRPTRRRCRTVTLRLPTGGVGS